MANEENFPEVRHRQVATNGITMHVAEQGDLSAPSVLLIHGFPELWLSWRHQMAALAANGYRAIAPDLRGYGDTDVPADPAAYTIFHIVGDLIGLLDHLELPRVGGDSIINEDLNGSLRRSDINKAILVPTGIIPTSSITYLTWSVLGIKDHVSPTTAIVEVFVVGHDWGAVVAWHLCLFRPDRIKALVNLAYPYFPRHPSIKPTDHYKALGEGFYITQFQEPGRAETSIDKYGALTILKKIFSIKMEKLCAPPGMEIMDFLEAPTSLPEWISEDELQYFAEKFQKNGFTGPLNYYRNLETNWTLTAPWQGAKILVPTKFIVGDKDIGFKSFGTELHIKSGGLKAIVPDLDVVILNGCYHFIQQEKAEEVTSQILSYFSSPS